MTSAAPPRYAPLRVHSHYSLLGGVGSPEEILARAAALGIECLAATESEGLYGALAWARAARSSPVRVVLGVELALPSPRRDGALARAIFLAQDLAGYRALCRLVTAHRLRRAASSFGEAGLPLPAAVSASHDLPPEDLPAHDLEALFVLVDEPHLLARWARVVPRGRLFAALGRDARGKRTPPQAETLDADPRKAPDPAPPRALEPLLRAARELDVPTVVAEDTWFPEPQDAPVHRRLLAIKHAALEAQIEAHASRSWLRSPAEMAARWSEHREALERSAELAAQCRFELPLGAVHFPRCPLPEGESAFSRLWALAQEGARRRYRPPTPEVARRLEHELRVIHELGFADYFLLVKRIRDFAAERDIPCIGRGSAADSLVAYVLGLTEADPLRYALPFERFLNPARKDRPDIDLDFCWRRRDEVLQWVYASFGAEKTAMICTQSTFGLRSAFRETAKALGLPPHEVDRWSRALPHGFESAGDEFDGTAASAADESGASASSPLAEDSNAWRLWQAGAAGAPRPGGVLAAALATPECRGMPIESEPLRSVLLTADRILGTPRHLGLHPGGVVVAPSALTDFLSLERAAKGVIVTQLDKDDVEELGLVKMDLLGNRGLTTLREARAFVASRPGAAPLPPASEVPEDDPHTAGLLAAGDTLGCFQIESPAMRTLLKQMGASNMDRVIQSIALIRPGPAQSGMKDAFVRRAQGLEAPSFPHAKLTSVLRETFGVMLYQEDVLFVARAIAGFTLSQADELRRAMKRWREPAAMAELEQRFLAGACGEGVDEASAQRIWRLVQSFGNFSFCKAHAVTYGRMAYEAAWLKAHHPLELLCAFLNSDTGYYETRVYIEDVRRRGFAILPPDLHRSQREFSLEYARERSVLPSTQGVPARGALRVGFGSIRGLRESTLEALLDARREGPILNLRELLERVPLDRREAESLILCGALDGFERTRPELLWRLRLLLGATPSRAAREQREARAELRNEPPERARRVRLRAGWDQAAGSELFPSPEPAEPRVPSLPELDAQRRAQLELELLGFTTAHHPLDFFEELLSAANPVPCAELPQRRGQRVTIVGWLVTTRRARTSNGEWMRFLSLEDRSGIAETVLFPAVYRRYGDRLRGLGPYIARGIVDGGEDGSAREVDEHGLPLAAPEPRAGSTACTLRLEFLERCEPS
ncbi:MAG: DNA polymerase III subunit alpha [Planctomycetes bacterium]|nr:DNA polymerase III subunit alpha [Planctomycetota bacterium]